MSTKVQAGGSRRPPRTVVTAYGDDGRCVVVQIGYEEPDNLSRCVLDSGHEGKHLNKWGVNFVKS